jgi:hypothetical protein
MEWYYHPASRYYLTHTISRDATGQECSWILANCRKAKTVEERYVPSFNVDRLPASVADKYVKQ